MARRHSREGGNPAPQPQSFPCSLVHKTATRVKGPDAKAILQSIRNLLDEAAAKLPSPLRVMSLAVQSPDQHLISFAAPTAIGRNHVNRPGEAAGMERSIVSRESLITRSDDGYFNTDSAPPQSRNRQGAAPACYQRAA